MGKGDGKEVFFGGRALSTELRIPPNTSEAQRICPFNRVLSKFSLTRMWSFESPGFLSGIGTDALGILHILSPSSSLPKQRKAWTYS